MMYKDDLVFMQAVSKVFQHEGGYVVDAKDPGGETNFGISKRSYPNVKIKDLTQDGARVIYYNDFWIKNHYNEIKDSVLAAKALDLAINIGALHVNKFLQRLVGVEDDGIVGKKTIAAINSADNLYNGLLDSANKYYDHLIQVNPNLQKFKNGWLNRLHN